MKKYKIIIALTILFVLLAVNVIADDMSFNSPLGKLFRLIWEHPAGFIVLISLVGLGLVLNYTGTWEYVVQALESIRQFTYHLIDTAPSKVKLFIFIFLFIAIGSVVTSLVVGIIWTCNGNEVRTPTIPMIGGTYLYIWDTASGLCVTDDYCSNSTSFNQTRDEMMGNWTTGYSGYFVTDESVVKIQCNGHSPQLRILNIDIFDYRIIILLLIISGLISLLLKI